MGDSRRFDLFAKFISRNFPVKSYRIADIAGGKGYLNLALRKLGYSNVTTFDIVKNKVSGILHKKRFHSDIDCGYDLLVGLHPDEATDHIIVAAGRNVIPFVVVPCCVKPDAIPYNGSRDDANWNRHLCQLARNNGFKVVQSSLPMNGKNMVIVGKP